jgi:ArsR family transcriptional regulator, arsenate/arsenite/antimonite-responsive transcriptional repressor
MNEHIAVEALSALAHNSRLAIFRLLVPEGPDGLAAGKIGEQLNIAPTALSFHLTRLRYARLVSVRRNGQQMIYAAAYDEMQRLMGFLNENCCQLDARGCSSNCPQTSTTRKKRKRVQQKVRAA